jgi:hypothetical protein
MYVHTKSLGNEMKWKAFGNEIHGHKTHQISKRLKCYVSKAILSTSTPSIECYYVKATLFFHNLCVYIMCVCVLFVCFLNFLTHTKGQNPKPFFSFGGGWDIICKRDRWWVYWLLIVYALLLLPWQFSTFIYLFFRNVEIFKFFLFSFPSK